MSRLIFSGIILALLFINMHNGWCQVPDTYEQEIDQLPEDTVKANKLLNLGEKYCAVDNQKALYYLQESLYLSNQLNYKHGIAWSYLWLGRVYYYKDEYKLARTSIYKSKKMLDELGDDFGLTFYYFTLGSISHIMCDYVNAIDEFQQVVFYAERAGNKLYQSAGTFSLGSVHFNRDEYAIAAKYIRASLKTKLEISDHKGIANAYNLLGRLNKTIGYLDSAMHYFELAYEIRKAHCSSRAIANSLVPMAELEIIQGNYSPAIEMLGSALEIYGELDEKTGICIVENALALAYNGSGNKTKASQLINKAMIKARQFDNTSMILECLTTMAKMEAENKDFERAYQLSVDIAKLRDSLNIVNREEIIQEMTARFNLEQKNSEIDLLNHHNSIQQKNIILLSVSIGALAVLLVLMVIMFRLKARAHQRQEKLLEQEKTILEQAEKIKEKEMQLLHENVESKNRELATKAIEMLRVNETIGEVINKLEAMGKIHARDSRIAAHIKEIASELENQTNTNTWKEFDKIFKNIHTEFYDNLLKACSSLTASEIKIAALLRLNLSTKEMAAITYKSEEGIKSTRYRLRKKLNLAGEDNLIPFLMRL